MADKKISALPAATTPLAGTEVLPIVQGGTTDQVSVANLTAGRAVSSLSVTTTQDVTTGRNLIVTGAGRVEQNGGAGGLYFLNTAVSAGATNMRFYTTNASGVAQLQYQLNGGTTPTNQVYGNLIAETGNFVISTTAKGLTTGSSIPLGFGVNNSVADMTLDTSGNLIIGSTNLGGRLSVFTGSGVGQFIRVQQISATVMEFRNAQDLGGSITIVAGGATSFNTVSDERLKHDIVDAPDAANLIDALQVRSFKWKVDDTAQRYGFIAQELLEVAPEAVNVPEDEDKMMGVDYSKLVPMLVKEVQSLRARVAQLEGK